ncbi:hypothetical protein JTE90_006072 [Oedothorax gibbosus]|uniref:MAGUK p55 subfamily member 5-A n=1 Tax=Oedothorax gibbosus TaxID=931172 RepID=A0AAV6V5Y2_9ARAC|nr:hypothetical protein JTE90_006072 [Oedothorax gibbosus]
MAVDRAHLSFKLLPVTFLLLIVGHVIVRDTFLISVGGQPPEEEARPAPSDMTQSSPLTPQHPPANNNNGETASSLDRKKSSSDLRIQKEEPQEMVSDAMKDPALNNNNPSMSSLVQSPRHRERAVDVPDTFVAVTKTTPRYPPPRKKPPRTPETSSLKKNGLYHFSSEGNGNNNHHHVRSVSSQDGNNVEEERRTPPTPRISELVRDSNQPEEKLVDLGQLHRIKKYQDSLRRRKEEGERQSKEEEFLRSSLRGSKKLRALTQATCDGVDNSGFRIEDEADTASTATASEQKELTRLYEFLRSSLRGSKKLRALTQATCDGVDNSGFRIEDEADTASTATASEQKELTRLYDSSELLSLLRRVESSLSNTNCEESVLSVEKLLLSPTFQTLLQLHNRVQERCCFKCMPNPVCSDAQLLSAEVVDSLHESPSPAATELLGLLESRAFEGLMLSHDRVAASQATPDVSEEEELLARLSQYAEDSIKIVRIDKTTEPLGATVKNDGEAVIVGRIIKGGIAEKSGLLHEGDEILEVNGLELRGKSVNDVCDIMASMSGTLTFLIVPTQFDSPKPPSKELVTHLKAYFDYEPEDDPYLPCRELGMSFQKGDVLHVLNTSDPNWWQAYREGEEEQMLAGLIPSRSFQHQREMMKRQVIGDIRERKSKKGKFLCAKRHHRRKKKKMYNVNYNEDVDPDQVLTYEEVRLYYPRAHHKRPLVLIGPQKVGRHELRQKLMEDTNRFAAAVPHTSRPKKDSEVNGVDYFFISRVQFEADIAAGKFVEHGEYQKSYYGTSLEAIRSVIRSGKTCVLNLHPQSLHILKKSDLLPYVVFVAPPSLDKLRANCLRNGEPNVRDSELREIIERARSTEECFGHLFDLALVNVDTDKTLARLLNEVSLIEREPQWVPASWVTEE